MLLHEKDLKRAEGQTNKGLVDFWNFSTFLTCFPQNAPHCVAQKKQETQDKDTRNETNFRTAHTLKASALYQLIVTVDAEVT